jgi:hypothetical protein
MQTVNNAPPNDDNRDQLLDQSFQLNFSAENSRTLEQMLRYPTLADYQDKNWESIAKMFNENHQVLLNYLKQNELRYFGIHGTGDIAAKGIIANPKYSIEIVTFYEKEASEKRLFQLYHGIAYTSIYAFTHPKTTQPGGILLFDLEFKDINISDKYEFLKPGAFPTFGILGDSAETNQLLNKLRYAENLLWRGAVYLSEDFIKDRFLGLVGIEAYNDREQLRSLGSSIDNELFSMRFFAQKTLCQILNLMKNRSEP